MEQSGRVLRWTGKSVRYSLKAHKGSGIRITMPKEKLKRPNKELKIFSSLLRIKIGGYDYYSL